MTQIHKCVLDLLYCKCEIFTLHSYNIDLIFLFPFKGNYVTETCEEFKITGKTVRCCN